MMGRRSVSTSGRRPARPLPLPRQMPRGRAPSGTSPPIPALHRLARPLFRLGGCARAARRRSSALLPNPAGRRLIRALAAPSDHQLHFTRASFLQLTTARVAASAFAERDWRPRSCDHRLIHAMPSPTSSRNTPSRPALPHRVVAVAITRRGADLRGLAVWLPNSGGVALLGERPACSPVFYVGAASPQARQEAARAGRCLLGHGNR